MSSYAPIYAMLDESQKLIVWRLRWLEELGYGTVEATVLARDRSIDMHDLDDLVKSGCPRDVALRILR